MTNAAEVDRWNGPTGEYWARQADHYDRVLGPLTPHLLRAAALRPTDRVLDVGCGCGATTRAAARLAAEVLGIDLSEPMLARAGAVAADEGLTNVRFLRADAQVDPFTGFDVVISQLGVMFFEDPTAAFANLRRAASRLAFVCWQGGERNEPRQVERAALSPHVPLPPPPPDGSPGPLAFADPVRVRELLAAAGYTSVDVEDVPLTLSYGRDAEEALRFKLDDPGMAGLFAEAGPEAAARATQALHEAYAARETDDGVLFNAAIWLVTASS